MHAFPRLDVFSLEDGTDELFPMDAKFKFFCEAHQEMQLNLRDLIWETNEENLLMEMMRNANGERISQSYLSMDSCRGMLDNWEPLMFIS
jgi:hypothetical protein